MAETPEQAAAAAAAKAADDAKKADDAADAAKAAAAAGAASSGKSVSELEAEVARTAAALSAANRESEGRRKELKALKDAEEARNLAAMSETERLKKELEAANAATQKAQEAAKETLVRSAFISAAAQAGVAHPEDVFLLADRSGVVISDVGKVEGVAEAVKSLVDSGRVPMSGKPKAPNLDGGAGGPTRGQAAKLSADEIEMARVMGLTPEKYAENKAAMALEQE